MLGGSVLFLSQIFIFFLFSCDEFKKFFLNENETFMVLDNVCGRHCSISTHIIYCTRLYVIIWGNLEVCLT